MLMNNNKCECDEIHAIPPKTNQWASSTQSDHHHYHKVSSSISMAAAASSPSSVRVMDQKPGQDLLHNQHQQQTLKCPRCDSSNTKFCYYNNYNLSQPRHFCKACKRYWTRGGTLRNVPVGGGCRKNKRLKRHTPPSTSTSIHDTNTTSPSPSPSPSSSTTTTSTPPTSNPPNSQHQINPLFYDNNSTCEVMNLLPFPGFTSRLSSSGYDLQPHPMNALGGFGIMSSTDDNGYRIQAFSANNNTFLSTYNSIFGSNSGPTTPVMASLLSSNLLQHKFNINNGGLKLDDGAGSNSYNTFQQQGSDQTQDLQMRGTVVASSKEVKGDEQGQDDRLLLDWNIGSSASQNHQMEDHVPLSDPSSLYWNTASALPSWTTTDQPNNIGPSLTSLI